MNKLKNGPLIVVIATVVTAILILMTGRDNPSSLNENTDAIVIEEKTSSEVVFQVAAASDDDGVKLDTSVVNIEGTEVKNVTVPLDEGIKIDPPKGPFSKASSGEASTEKLDSELDKQQKTTKTEIVDEKANLHQAVKVKSNSAMTKSAQPELRNDIQPIWMDQKVGDFKSIEQGNVVFKIMPTSADGLQGKNPVKVITNNNDKFAVLTVSEDYNYQQMPLYNGGYYIAPMPSYLMSSLPPKSHSE